MCLPRARRYFSENNVPSWIKVKELKKKGEKEKRGVEKGKKNFCEAETWLRRSQGNSPRNEFLKREYEDIDVEHFAYDKLFFFHKEEWLVLERLESVAGEKSVSVIKDI